MAHCGYDRVKIVKPFMGWQPHTHTHRERETLKERKVKFKCSTPHHVTLETLAENRWCNQLISMHRHRRMHAGSLFMNKVIRMHWHDLDWGLNPSNGGKESEIEALCLYGDESTAKSSRRASRMLRQVKQRHSLPACGGKMTAHLVFLKENVPAQNVKKKNIITTIEPVWFCSEL